MAHSRKVNFYEIIGLNNLDVRQSISTASDLWKVLHHAKDDNRKYATSSNDIIQLMQLDLIGNKYNGLIKLIKDEFPVVHNKQTDETETIDGEYDPDKGIPEETHFVISVHPILRHPVIGVESTMQGVKYKDVKHYFESMMMRAGIPAELIFEPVYAFSYEEFLQRIDEVAQISLMFHRDEVSKYSQYDRSTGEMLFQVMDFGDPEYVTVELYIDFRKRTKRWPTDGLKRKLLDLVGVLMDNPEAKNYMKRFDVKATDRNFGGRLRLFDLIESKVASEVKVERRGPRSQYYDSHSIHASIRAQIEKDFEGGPAVVLPRSV